MFTGYSFQQLILVRHGESEQNLALSQKKAGLPVEIDALLTGRHTSAFRLTTKGQRQATAAGEWLRSNGLSGSLCLVSPYARALETASLLNLPHAEWRINDLLRERCWGKLDKLPQTVRDETYDDAMRRDRDMAPLYWRPPEGETLADVCTRLNLLLLNLQLAGVSEALMVCHGEVMWAFRYLIENMTIEEFRALHLSKHPWANIYNCEIIHYRAHQPGEPLCTYVQRTRAHEPDSTLPWAPVRSAGFSTAELMKLADQYPRLYDGSA